MKTYNPTLAVGEVYTVAGGNTFHLITAPNGINVQYLKADLTDINETATDVESGYFVKYPHGFDLVKITNGAIPQTIKFGVARDGEGGYNISSNQIIGGTLDDLTSLHEFKKDAAIGAKHFYGCYQPVVSSSNYTHTQLKNATANNRVIVKSCKVISKTAALIGMDMASNSLLSTYAGLRRGGLNKLSGGSESNCEYLSGNNATLHAGNHRIWVPANTPIELIHDDGLIVDNGYSLLVQAKAVNIDFLTHMEYAEIAI